MPAIGKCIIKFVSIIIYLGMVAGCNFMPDPQRMMPSKEAIIKPTLTTAITQTPFQPQQVTATQQAPTPSKPAVISLGFSTSVPEALQSEIKLQDGMVFSTEPDMGDFLLSQTLYPGVETSSWVFALAAPFPTVRDNCNRDELIKIWRGEPVEGWEGVQLVMAEPTRRMLTDAWGASGDGAVLVINNQEERITKTWADQQTMAIIPFEELEPRWKVIKVDGVSPLDKGLNQAGYFLTFFYKWEGSSEAIQLPVLPVSNRLDEKMTVITMTGVTALTRATGFMMDKYGITYPGEDIRDWMTEADFTHVSNEVSFDPDCPAQDPNQQGLRFCSRPDYIQLLEYVGVDIVELTGNHLMDFKPESLPFSMEMYRQRGWLTFGGGENIEIASQPAFLEHNGNRFAFVGCNPAGPGGDWAGPGNAGTQPCDWEAFREQIRTLTGQGYMVIATLQYAESYMPTPVPQQSLDFRSLSEAGAVIVSGSQAHFPQSFEFLDGKFIHYGLGNLFFDQMDYPVVGTRREFLDRHVFYNGKHISTELLTAMLENYARPRPMRTEERADFLQDLFSASGW